MFYIVMANVLMLLSLVSCSPDLDCNQIPFNTQTVSEFIECRRAMGSDIEMSEPLSGIIDMGLSTQIYPYAEHYTLSHSISGKRIKEGVRRTVSMRFNEATDTVKYVKFSMSPEIKTLEEIAREVVDDLGYYDADEFIKRNNAQYASEDYQQGLRDIYARYEKLLSQQGQLIENRSFPPDYPLTKIHTYRINGGFYELSYELNDTQKRSVNLSVYWK